MIDTYTCAKTFQAFVDNDLRQAIERFDHEEAGFYIYCGLTGLTGLSRRVLVITEPNSAKIAVCIEAAYHLFEGDTHHYVRQVGTIDRAEAASKLEPLVREAYEIVMSWKPTLANIEDNAFLPN